MRMRALAVGFARACRVMFWSTAALIAAATAEVRADIMYIGNGSVPDFQQDWGAAQKNKAICQGATAADVMWYWDQNGYPGLVKHQDPKNPNNTWEQDGQALVYLMANYCYGLNPVNNAISPLGQSTPFAALGKYIKTQGQYSGQVANGLVVDYTQAASATYANWVSGIKNGGVLMGGVAWNFPSGKTVQHAMVSAGVDSTNENLVVSHGWDPHQGAAAPYQSPPANPPPSPPFINLYPMTVNQNGKATIDNPGNASVDLFGGGYNAATSMTLFEFYNIHPKAKANVNIKPKAGLGFDNTYDSDVSNDSFAPIYQYVQEVETPIDAASAPPGWTAIPWNYGSTPDVTAPAFESAQPPYDTDPLQPLQPPALNGILFYTTTNPILPGSGLDGFTFDSSQAYTGMAEDSMSFVSDGVSASIDANTTGLDSELLFPTLVPEPSTLALLGVAVCAAAAYRRLRLRRG